MELFSLPADLSQNLLHYGSLFAEGLPPSLDWLPLVMLLTLAGTALYDAFTGRVPDAPLFLGLLVTTAAIGLAADWPLAAERLTLGLGVAIGLWAVNQLYRFFFQRDALGMGDAKWSLLAVTVFGLLPVVYAWVVGAWLALIWLGGAKLARRLRQQDAQDGSYVHFAPFLFLGLLAGLYWHALH
ncbi:MAG: hypothetical protein HGA90_00965 [Alphaproteobacteria bacterium]|nr:hypothetical protein [Alphaproteobacteria bacterium]